MPHFELDRAQLDRELLDRALLDRALAFLRDFARRRAVQVIDRPGAFAALDPRYPASYDNNKLVVTGRPAAEDLLALADQMLGGVGLTHRLVLIEDDRHGLSCAPALGTAGYLHEINLIMRYAPARKITPPRVTPTVVEVDPAGLREATELEWRTRKPSAAPEIVRQLVERREALVGAAEQVTFLAVRDGTGAVVSHADLYLEPGSGIAQIEDLVTSPGHTGQGYARALLDEARRRAETAGCDLLFLVADADDWPRHWYHRIGYSPLGSSHLFVRPAA